MKTSFASAPTYCINCKKRTFNDGSGVTADKMKNGTYLVKSICGICQKNKSVFAPKSFGEIMEGGSSVSRSTSSTLPLPSVVAPAPVQGKRGTDSTEGPVKFIPPKQPKPPKRKPLPYKGPRIDKTPTQSGEGVREIVQTVKNAFDALINGKRKGLSPSFKRMLKQHGDKDIVQISIVRKPVQKVLTSIINLITLGKFNQQMKTLNYDQVYHLSAILKLSDGAALFLEKNAVPELKPVSGNVEGEKLDVNMKKPIKLRQFVEKTYDRIGEREFVDYTAENLNCQKFILSHLQTFDLANKKIESWIRQDAAQLLSKDPNVYKALKAVTDLGALADVLQGRGISEGVGKFILELLGRITGRPHSLVKGSY